MEILFDCLQIFYRIIIIILFLILNLQMIHGSRASALETVNIFKHSSNVFIEDLDSEGSFYEEELVTGEKSIIGFIHKRKSGLIVKISISNLQSLNRYQDVYHVGENKIILESDPLSYVHHLKSPLNHIINNFCRFPLPRAYYITMDRYEDRLTTTENMNCSNIAETNPNCYNEENEQKNSFRRSINEPCLRQIGNAVLVEKDKAPELSDESNSIYCTYQSPIVNQLFHEKVYEEIAYLQNEKCELARKKCGKCLNKRCNQNHGKDESCCFNNSQCLLKEECEEIYIHNCYEARNVCYKGTTLKFSLTPEFIISNSSFQCHLNRMDINDYSLGKISVELFVPEKLYEFKYETALLSQVDVFGIIIEYTNQIKLHKSIILTHQNDSMYITSLLSENRKKKMKIPVLEFNNQKYVKVQMISPFSYSSETWSHETCDVNISKFLDVREAFDISHFRQVKINENSPKPLKENGKFIYNLRIPNVDDRISVTIKRRSSILKSLLCKTEKHNFLRNVKINATRLSEKSIRLEIRGYVTNSLAYVNVFIEDRPLFNVRYHFDLIVFPKHFQSEDESSFWIENDIDIDTNGVEKFQGSVIVIKISDCSQTFSRYIHVMPDNILELNSYKRLISSNHTPSDLKTIIISNNLKFILCLAVILWLLSVTFFLLYITFHCVQSYQRCFIFQRQFEPSKSNLFRKALIVVFIFLKILYVFFFTFSTILSLIITLNENNIFSSNSSRSHRQQDTMKFLMPNGSITDCSLTLEGDVRSNILTFNRKRNENFEICYRSHQSIQNETGSFVTTIDDFIRFPFNNRTKDVARNHKNEIQNLKQINLLYFKAIMKSSWLLGIYTVANRSSNEDLQWMKQFNFSLVNAKLIQLMNVPDFLLSLQHMNQAQNRFQTKSILKEHPKKRFDFIPPTFASASNTYKYFENWSDCLSSNSVKSSASCKVQNGLKKGFITSNKETNKLTFDIIPLRIFMLILDFFLIIHRSYRLYSDTKQMWIEKQTFAEYKYCGQYSEAITNGLTAEDEASFREINQKITSWTKRQDLYCLNSPEVIFIIIFVIMTVMVTGLLVCVTTRENSFFLMSFLNIKLRTERSWFSPSKTKSFKDKAIINMWFSQYNKMMKLVLSEGYNLSFRFNHNEQAVIGQYMWEQCHLEKSYRIFLRQRNSVHHRQNQANYCNMPLPRNIVHNSKAFCNIKIQNQTSLFVYELFQHKESRKNIFRATQITVLKNCFILYGLIILVLGLLGMVKTYRKLIFKFCISATKKNLLIIPNSIDQSQQNSLEILLLASKVNDVTSTNGCSINSYSCYKLDTQV